VTEVKSARARRSLLWVPGDQPKKLERSAEAGADVIVLDLEDGVAADRKDAARDCVKGALGDIDFGAAERFVRVAGRSTLEADIEAAHGADGLCIPKVERAADLDHVRAVASRVLGTVPPIVAISAESPVGVLMSSELVDAGEGVVGWMWGSEDLAGMLGCRPRGQGEDFVGPLKLARDVAIMLAAATGAQAIDTVYPFYRDLDGLLDECEAALACGFTGKGVIHPAQVPVVNDAFTPGEEETARARAVVEAFASGAGVIALDGQMLDLPHLRAAELTLARAAAAERR
jgi:citrate lyase subunit beta/citryl-CoA lyase